MESDSALRKEHRKKEKKHSEVYPFIIIIRSSPAIHLDDHLMDAESEGSRHNVNCSSAINRSNDGEHMMHVGDQPRYILPGFHLEPVRNKVPHTPFPSSHHDYTDNSSATVHKTFTNFSGH